MPKYIRRNLKERRIKIRQQRPQYEQLKYPTKYSIMNQRKIKATTEDI